MQSNMIILNKSKQNITAFTGKVSMEPQNSALKTPEHVSQK